MDRKAKEGQDRALASHAHAKRTQQAGHEYAIGFWPRRAYTIEYEG